MSGRASSFNINDDYLDYKLERMVKEKWEHFKIKKKEIKAMNSNSVVLRVLLGKKKLLSSDTQLCVVDVNVSYDYKIKAYDLIWTNKAFDLLDK